MIKVFFESSTHAEQVATFESEQIYMQCLPALEAKAKKQKMKVTETVIDETQTKFFNISGYWKDDKETFRDCLISVDSPNVKAREINDETTTNGVRDVDIFYYGLDEDEIKEAIRLGENCDQFDFVITSYKKA